MIDFAADVSFGDAAVKMQEHYQIVVSESTIQDITEHHTNKMNALPWVPEVPVEECMTSIDGTMIPSVRVNPDALDQRKTRQTFWREARLSVCDTGQHRQYRATLSNPDSAGHMWRELVECTAGPSAYVHAVCDGAPWIYAQYYQHFGQRGQFLVDMYHVLSYLGKVKDRHPMAPDWISECHNLLENNQVDMVLNQLKPWAETEMGKEDVDSPARVAIRYITNNQHNMDYKSAIEQGRAVGSGLVEGSHRTVVQKRLKISGAWWSTRGAQQMLVLRILRANELWETYWNQYL